MDTVGGSVQNLLANLLLHNVEVGTGNTDGVNFVPGAAPPFGLTTTPNNITAWKAGLTARWRRETST